VAEPLGRSQVVAYLERLAGDFALTLISFEKGSPAPDLGEHLRSAGIRWLPLRYHGSPPVASTAWDVTTGARAISRALRRAPGSILHARSYVAAEMVMRSARARRAPLLFDMRGFWVDERVEGGLLHQGAVYRIARRRERRFFERADAIVTLTHASVEPIRRRTPARDVPIEVIPTCTDVARFAATRQSPEGPRLVWLGSVGTVYRLDLARRMARLSGVPLAVLTRQVAEARALVGEDASVAFVPPAELPVALRAGDIGLCLYRGGFGRLATAPTRFAEHLAAGMPVAVTEGLGDLERIVEEDGVGCVVRGEDDASLLAAVERLVTMAASDEVRERCRRVAARRFDLDRGALQYAALYRCLTASHGGVTSHRCAH
jgi:glycosyltransferase involved in cell wall biosynthesis